MIGIVAVLTRFELATSAVTGRRSNQLSYSTKIVVTKKDGGKIWTFSPQASCNFEQVMYTEPLSKCERSIYTFSENANIFLRNWRDGERDSR